MSFAIGSLKYEIDKITRLTSSTKRLPLFAFLFQAVINESIKFDSDSTPAHRLKNLLSIKKFCEQETVQTMFIILYPLYKNLCMLTGRNPKDIAILLAKAINQDDPRTILDKIHSATGLDLRKTNETEKLTRTELSYMLQGRTTSKRKQPILPLVKDFFAHLEKFDPVIDPTIESPTTEEDQYSRIYYAASRAMISIVFLAIFMNLTALERFTSSDDETRAASLVLQKAVEAFRDNGVYDLPSFQQLRTSTMKPRSR